MHTLRAGLILEIARAAGLRFKEKADKSPLKCPFHDDRHASAVLIASTNCFYCSVCGGLSAKRFAEAVHVDWNPFARELRQRDPIPRPVPKPPTIGFGAEDAQATWSIALARARDDDHANEDQPVYDYLSQRGLMEAWEISGFGIVGPGMSLHRSIECWPSSGHQLVAPLYDATGAITNIQARAIKIAKPKTLFPEGSRAAGTLFASRSGLDLIRGDTGDQRVLLGEGLTDYLALSIASPVPVLSAPGTGMCASGIGSWARDRVVYLAMDGDRAGGSAVNPTAQAAFQHGARSVKRVRWPGGCKDACDVVAKFGLVALGEFLNEHTGEVAHG